MNYLQNIVRSEPNVNVKLLNYLPKIGIGSAREEIFTGLRAKQKYIYPKYFYDGRGSELFEEITQLEEYYPTRTEKKIIAGLTKKLYLDFSGLNIVELGSGDCSKISLLLEQASREELKELTYVPVDISESAIEKSSVELLKRFTLKNVTGIVADFYCQLNLIPKNRNRLFCFFGSTIGNFNAGEAKAFMTSLGKTMQPGDSLLLGADMLKDINVLERAYNDKKGVTAQFNKNILNVVNNLTGTEFDTSDFEHYAFFNEKKSRIEMHLRAMKDMVVNSEPDREAITVRRGETIHTENSNKFSADDVERFGKWAGLELQKILTDKNDWFSLSYYRKI